MASKWHSRSSIIGVILIYRVVESMRIARYFTLRFEVADARCMTTKACFDPSFGIKNARLLSTHSEITGRRRWHRVRTKENL